MSTIDAAFIQVDPIYKMPVDDTAFSVWSGCQQLDITTHFFTFVSDIQKDLSRKTLVHGGLTRVREALRCLGISEPHVPDAPEVLRPFFGRRLWVNTMKDFRQRVSLEPLFIKPLTIAKAFPAHVTSGSVIDMVQDASIPDSMNILVSEPVVFVSEYRVLVHNHIMVACRHYAGDFEVFPDMSIAEQAVQVFSKEAPCAYALDLGVTNGGRTLIVEINDAYALGSYGAPVVPYTQMVIDRWVEIVGKA